MSSRTPSCRQARLLFSTWLTCKAKSSYSPWTVRTWEPRRCRLSALWSLAFLLLLSPLTGIRAMVLVLGTTLPVVLLFAFWCRTQIGGATGDPLGAVCELTEAMVAVALANSLGFF